MTRYARWFGPMIMALSLAACGGEGSSSATATGTLSQAATTVAAPAPATTGTATLSWLAPTTNADGSALTNLSGYAIYYGTDPSSLTSVVNIGSPSTTSYTVTGLTAGTWYFALKSVDDTGLESALSPTVSKTIA
jgi:hypothetical protein